MLKNRGLRAPDARFYGQATGVPFGVLVEKELRAAVRKMVELMLDESYRVFDGDKNLITRAKPLGMRNL